MAPAPPSAGCLRFGQNNERRLMAGQIAKRQGIGRIDPILDPEAQIRKALPESLYRQQTQGLLKAIPLASHTMQADLGVTFQLL
ncbi:hypothetical protein D3C87_2032630 [compost metagenome]